MPIPADPVGPSDVASTVLTLFGQVHDQIRAEIEGLDADGLNWTPGPGTNSVATTITHLVGSEGETPEVWRALSITETVMPSSFSPGRRLRKSPTPSIEPIS